MFGNFRYSATTINRVLKENGVNFELPESGPKTNWAWQWFIDHYNKQYMELRNAIMDAGFDGIVYKDSSSVEGLSGMVRVADLKGLPSGAGITYIAFSPTQIKSATGNQGAFDKNNPNIMKSHLIVYQLEKAKKYPPGTVRRWRDGKDHMKTTDGKWKEVSSPKNIVVRAPGTEYGLSVPRKEYDEIKKRYQGTPMWMKAPNGEPTNLTERQWIQVRTPSFKKWFGDWEAVSKKRGLDQSPLVVVDKGTIKAGNGRTAIEAAVQWIEENQNHEVDTIIGPVRITKKAIKNSLGHTMYQNKLDVIPAIATVLSKGVYLGTMKDYSGKPIDNFYFASKVRIGEEQHVLFVRTRRAEGLPNVFYVHEVFTEEEIKKSEAMQTRSTDFGSVPGKASDLYRSIINSVLAVNENEVSKVVDENGEPLVVYHGTGAYFLSFRLSSDKDLPFRILFAISSWLS